MYGALLLIVFVVLVVVHGAFVHPGILHTRADLTRMQQMVLAKKSPWIEGFDLLLQDQHASATYQMMGPDVTVERGNVSNKGNTDFSQDAIAAYYNAVLYTITGNETHATTATNILVAWGKTLKNVTGHDAQLAASLYGYQMVNAAEIIRYYYSGWQAADIAVFEGMLTSVLYPIVANTTPPLFEANWGTGCIKTLLAFGVFLDNKTIYQTGLDLYANSTCGSLSVNLNDFGQSGESGRDQAHTQLGLGHQAEACQIAWNQGINIWDDLSDRVMLGYEYTAKYNLGLTVDYDPNFCRCDAYLVGGPWKNISAVDRGEFRPIYEIAYAHYASLQNISMPNTAQVLSKVSPEGPNPPNAIADNAAYGTLLFHLG